MLNYARKHRYMSSKLFLPFFTIKPNIFADAFIQIIHAKCQIIQQMSLPMLKIPWHATLWMLICRCQWAPYTVFSRNSRNSALLQNYSQYNTIQYSQSPNELSTKVVFLEAGQGVWCGCGPEQLAATVPCASVYSGTLNTPGAQVGFLELYIEIISYYIDIYII